MKNTATPIDDGGPAFPAPALGEKQFGDPAVYWGVSMRDFFAKGAMEATLGSEEAMSSIGEQAERSRVNPFKLVAKMAYRMADEMLKARAAS